MQDRLPKARSLVLTLVLASLALVATGCGGGASHTNVLAHHQSTPAPGLSSVPFQQSSSCTASTQSFSVDGLRVDTNIDYENVSQGGLCLDVLRPTDNRPHPAVVLLHGEGQASNLDGRESLRHVAGELAMHGFVAVDVDWPPYPAYHLPLSIKGVDTALSYVESHSSTFGVKPGHIGLLGTSAGGLVAGDVANQHIKYLKAIVTWSGGFDATGPLATPARLQKIFGCSTTCPPSLLAKYSAVHHVTSSTPPFALFNSSNELVPVSQPQAMAAALSAAGVPHKVVIYPGSQHAVAYAAQATGPTIQWFDKYLG